MYKHLLVPLDGSKLAEAALPPAAFLSEKLCASVTLIHVVEKNPPTEIHGEHHLANQEEACDYLNQIAKETFSPEVKVECHVHTEEVSDVARSIVDHTGEFSPDLIVMCTHGSGGLHDLMVGSIAQQVIGYGTTPILLIQPRERGERHFTPIQRILVPLDTDPIHNHGLNDADKLAIELDASLHLMHVVPTLGTLSGRRAATGRMLPVATSAMLDMTEEAAHTYLDDLADTWRDEGLTVTTEVWRGDPPQQIMHAARRSRIDLIVLGTHGKSGMQAFWAGSVAVKVTKQSEIPILLVPVGKE